MAGAGGGVAEAIVAGIARAVLTGAAAADPSFLTAEAFGVTAFGRVTAVARVPLAIVTEHPAAQTAALTGSAAVVG